MITALIEGLLKTGAPWGFLCAALALAVLVLWRRCKELSDKVIELAVSQTKVQTETRQTLRNVEKDVEDISRRFEIPMELRRGGRGVER